MLLSPVLMLMALAGSPAARCPVPAVELAGADRAFAERFAPGSAGRQATEANLREAFRAACSKGLVRGDRMPTLSNASARRVALENWPEANVASLEAEQLRSGRWRLILGFGFLADDGSVHIPDAAEIEEAIYCAVRGATPAEQETDGRCLSD